MDARSIAKRWFSDYLNPTFCELKVWLEDPESFEPEQDWDIIIGGAHRLPVFVRLAINDGPQREFIIHYLHVATANAFYHDRDRIHEGIGLVRDEASTELLEWKRKAMFLLESPKSFREKDWFDYMYNK